MGKKRITKKKYIEACEKHPPNWWVVLIFKYFSKTTTNENFKLKNFVISTLLALFFVGMISSIIKISDSLTSIITIIYSLIIALIIIVSLSTILINNVRLNKIRKELGVSKHKFNEIVRKYS